MVPTWLSRFDSARHLEADGRPAEARTVYEALIADHPDAGEPRVNLANLLLQAKENARAIGHFRQAIETAPDLAEAWAGLGTALRTAGQSDKAVEILREAAGKFPQRSFLWRGLADALNASGKQEEARLACLEALRLDPQDAGVSYRLASYERRLGNRDASINLLRQVLALQPDHADAHFALGMNLLATGAYAEGWREYEWRWRCADFPQRRIVGDEWDGAPAQNLRLLVHAEQGYGDTIQCLRFVSRLRPMCGTLIFYCQRELAALVEAMDVCDIVVAEGDASPAFDAYIAVMSLPRIFGSRPGDVASGIPYLSAPDGRKAAFDALIADAGDKLKIGLVLQGRPSHPEDATRSIPAEIAAPLGDNTDMRVFTLFSPGVPGAIDVSDQISDFADSAALFERLDIIVSVDTATAHLAGALGCPTLLMLSKPAEWRWMSDRSDTPWYPTVRLLRQRSEGDWRDVIARSGEFLRSLKPGEPEETLSRIVAPTMDTGTGTLLRSAAQLLPAGARVIAIGNAAAGLEDMLPAGSHVTVAGFSRPGEATSTGEPGAAGLPERGDATHWALLAILENLPNSKRLMTSIRATNLPVIVSYSPLDTDADTIAGTDDHLSALPRAALEALFEGCGYRIAALVDKPGHPVVFRLEPRIEPDKSPGDEAIGTMAPGIIAAGARAVEPPPARVLVLSYSNATNFGHRLGRHVITSVLPAECTVEYGYFRPWTIPAGNFDLMVLGIGNSLFKPLLTDELIELTTRTPRTIGIFGTQYRAALDRDRMARLLDGLDHWYARSEEDMLLYGHDRNNVSHLGDWLVDAFSITSWRVDAPLHVGRQFMNTGAGLDRAIETIQSHRTVRSEHLHPLLCALTSAERVSYREQRELPDAGISGKFRSLLMDIFRKEYPESQEFAVDRDAVTRYKTKVRQNLERLRLDVAGLLRR